jgi:hypothetical protein
MNSEEIKAEVIALQIKQIHYEQLFEKSLKNPEELTKTRTIFRELKKITERLDELWRIDN